MKHALTLAASIAALAFSSAASVPASAEIVTFDSQATPGFSSFGNGTTYEENGLTFTSSVVASNALAQWGSASASNADPGGATIFQAYPPGSITVTRTGEGSFFLDSFDLADLYNRGAASVIPFSYTNASGTTNTALSLDPFVGLQTFDLNLAGVTSFSLGQSSTYFQLDNIVFDASTRALPEPSTWAMMMLGFGLVGATMRRRKQRAGLRFAF